MWLCYINCEWKVVADTSVILADVRKKILGYTVVTTYSRPIHKQYTHRWKAPIFWYQNYLQKIKKKL